MLPLRFLRKRRILLFVILTLFILGCLAALKVISSSEKDKLGPKIFNQEAREEIILNHRFQEASEQKIGREEREKIDPAFRGDQP